MMLTVLQRDVGICRHIELWTSYVETRIYTVRIVAEYSAGPERISFPLFVTQPVFSHYLHVKCFPLAFIASPAE